MTAVGPIVVKVLFAIAVVAGGCFIVVQMFDETRDKFAAMILKPVPAICCSIACFLSMMTLRHTTPVSDDAWRIDAWCMFFGIGFVFFAIGDALLFVHVAPSPKEEGIHHPNSSGSGSDGVASHLHDDDDDEKGVSSETKLSISGASMFAVGQLMLLIGMYARRLDEFMPFAVDWRIGLLYGTLTCVAWIAVVVGTVASPTCNASLAMAVLVATYLAIVAAVAWRACDIFAGYGFTGTLAIAIGAHIFFASDLFVASNSLCDLLESNPAGYYFWAMSTYYAAIVLEGYGVTKYAIETWMLARTSKHYSA